MRYPIAFAVAVALSGCPGVALPGTAYYPGPEDQQLFDELEARWEHAGLERIGGRCHEARRLLRVVVVPTDDYRSLCTGWCPTSMCPGGRASQECQWGCRDACYTDPCVGSWPHCAGTGNEALGGHETPLIVVHEDAAPDGYPRAGTLRHEYLHFLGTCTGRGIDRSHADRERWELL